MRVPNPFRHVSQKTRAANERAEMYAHLPRLLDGWNAPYNSPMRVKAAYILRREGWSDDRLVRVASLYGQPQAGIRIGCELYHMRGLGAGMYRLLSDLYPELGLPPWGETMARCQGANYATGYHPHPGKEHGVDYGVPHDEDGTGTGR